VLARAAPTGAGAGVAKVLVGDEVDSQGQL
jgi:hypothetical protein